MQATLSRLDLTNDEVQRDCLETFRRARDFGGRSALADWAARWGDSIATWLVENDALEAEALRDQISALQEELEEAGGIEAADLSRVERAMDSLRSAIEGGFPSDKVAACLDRLEGEIDSLPKAS